MIIVPRATGRVGREERRSLGGQELFDQVVRLCVCVCDGLSVWACACVCVCR